MRRNLVLALKSELRSSVSDAISRDLAGSRSFPAPVSDCLQVHHWELIRCSHLNKLVGLKDKLPEKRKYSE